MRRCPICDTEECTNSSCLKTIEDAKNRIKEQNRKYYNRPSGKALCRACDSPVVAPKRLCDKCRKSKLNERQRLDRERRREERYCKNSDCSKVMPREASNATRYCCDDCRPKKQATAKKLIDKKKKEVYKPKEEKKYNIDPYWLTRGNISTTGDR